MKVKNRACELNVTFSGIISLVKGNEKRRKKIDTLLNVLPGRMLFAHKYLSRECLTLIPH